MLGSNVNNVALSNCYASGKVTGYAIVGGLVGYNENAAIENCVAANDTIIATNSSTSINRIIGSNYASTLTNNYANEDMIVESGGSPFNITADKGTSGKAGADQTMATLKTLSFYNATALWDIDGTENSAVIWRICENTSLPFFQWQEDIVCPTPPDAIFCGGDGTLGNPYLICNPEQLDSIRYFLDDHFKLADDINLTTYLASGAGFDKWDVDGWLPIGDDSNPFTGSFHGGGHTISGLTINRGGYGNNNIGLFGYLDGAEIDSLGIVDCDITGNMYVGGLTGRNDYNAVISNCYVTGNVTGDIVGGLAGENNNAATIENCYATTNVTGNVTGNFVGGLVGANRNATISNCYAAGNVTGYDAVGGLAGTNAYATIENCVAANASVTATNFMFPSINRITSYNSGTFTNNYAFDGMIVKAGGSPVSITPNANGIEGADVDMATLKTALFYDTQGWDIDNVINPLKIWRICEGLTLPFLQWQEGIDCPKPIIICPTQFTDEINEITYDVVELAGLCWFTENLRNTKYADGTEIPLVKLYNDLTQNEINFGLLYTYASLTSYLTPLTSICPDGWRIPTSAEWALLDMYDVNDLNNKDFWLKPNDYTNSTDFDIRGAGFYNSITNRFEDLYRNTAFWSSDEPLTNTCYGAMLRYHCNQIEIVEIKKADAVSVRCVKN